MRPIRNAQSDLLGFLETHPSGKPHRFPLAELVCQKKKEVVCQKKKELVCRISDPCTLCPKPMLSMLNPPPPPHTCARAELAFQISSGGFSNYFPRPPYQDKAVRTFLKRAGAAVRRRASSVV